MMRTALILAARLAVVNAACPPQMPAACEAKGNCHCSDAGSFYFYQCGSEACNMECEGCHGSGPSPTPPAPTPTPPSPTPPAPTPPVPVPPSPAGSCYVSWGSCPNGKATDTCQQHLDYAMNVEGHDCASSLTEITAQCSSCAPCVCAAPTPAPKPAPPAPTPAPAPAPTPTPIPAPTPGPPTPHPSPPGSLINMKGVCYGALPCSPTAPCSGIPAEDMVQAGYQMQWGSKGRDDLGMIKTLGGNAVRLYHSIGLEEEHDHSAFLNYAHQLGVHVLPGIHTNMACNNFDCFDSWKAAVLKSFEKGFKQGGTWHQAIPIVILMNEPDFFNTHSNCPGQADWCRTKAALSAMDGLLAAEKEAGVHGSVNLTITWSFGMRTSVDGKVRGPGVYGFQDMVAIIQDPSKAHYTPKTSQAELAEAFRTRWVHSLNAAAPYSYIKQTVDSVYKQFEPHPWFIGEHGMERQTREVIEGDLQASSKDAQADGYYMGLSVFQFQQSYQKGSGFELNFGLFSLGNSKIGQTEEVFENGRSATWPVYCLNTNLKRDGGLSDVSDHRAEAVAKGWGGSAASKGRCSNELIV